MQAIKRDVSPDPILEATRSIDDVVNLQQMNAVLHEHCRSENHTLAADPQRMALVQTEMQRRRKSKADTRGFLTATMRRRSQASHNFYLLLVLLTTVKLAAGRCRWTAVFF